jgi:hypothetical protein
MYLDDVKAIATTPPPAVDVKVTSVGLVDTVNLPNPYYTSGTVTNLSPVNATATFTVTRKINPGGYVSTKTVTDLTANKDTTIVFDPWTFIPGTNYTIRDSVFIIGDGTAMNDTLQGNLIPYELPCKAYEEFPAPVSYANRGWTTSGTSAMYLFYSGTGFVDKNGMPLDATTNKGALYANFYNVSSGTGYFVSSTFTPTVLADSLYFDYAYRSYAGELDELYLETSTDGGNTWSQLDYLPGGSTVGVGMVTDVPSSTQFAPTAASQWRTKQYVLPVGTNKVRFKAVTGYGNNLWLNNIYVGLPKYTWMGTTNTSWTTKTNWNTNFPPLYNTPSVIIPSGTPNDPTSNTALTIRDFSIAANVTLTNNGGFTITGNLANNGTISGTNNLTLGTSATATFGPTSVLNISNVGSIVDFANRPVTLQSTSAGTARIANILGTLSNATAVTIQTYIPGGKRAFRFLGHPFSNNLDMSSLMDNIFVTGTGGASNGFDATASNNPSSFWFNNATQTWDPFTSSLDASWNQFKAIRTLVRGDRTQTTTLTSGTPPTPNAVTLDVEGTINTGNQNIAVPLGYSVLSNPYPSPVDLGTRLNATANIGTQYWVWDANGGINAGGYTTKVVTPTPYNLAMGAGFVVEPTSATTINFVEADKQDAATTNLFRTSTVASGILELQVLYNNYPADNLFVRFNSNASDDKDILDGKKLTNPELNFYIISADNKELSLDTRPYVLNKIIPLAITTSMANTFTIKVSDFGITESVLLHDKFLNTLTPLQQGTEYTFTVDPANPNTLGSNRFELQLKTIAALPTKFMSVTATKKEAGIAVNFTTSNEINMSSYEIEESNNGTSFTKGTTIMAINNVSNSYNWLDATIENGNNFYRIKGIDKNGTISYSQIVNVKIGSIKGEFTIYPNPVKNGIVKVQFNNMEAATYQLRIINNIGQTIITKSIKHAGGSSSQSIQDERLLAGTYILQLSNGASVINQKLIVE